MSFPGFGPGAVTFLRALARNNRKEWFEANRTRYEQELRQPLLALIEEVDARLGTLAPEIVGTRRSLFRIHRDVRFSADKRPYKTNAACWFYHRDAGRAVGENAAHGGAGFYFHLEPGGSFAGGGIWMPPRPALDRIRTAIADDHECFAALVTDRSFRRRFGGLDEEQMLKRMPRGYEADHPAGAWLRHRSFTAGRPVDETVIGSPRLVDALLRDYAALLPMVRWLNAASGLLPAERR